MIVFFTMTRSITLRNPDFRDSKSYDSRMSVKNMMDGSFKTYKRTGMITVHSLSFNNLTRDKAIEVRDFLADSIGKVVTYIDMDENTYHGRLTQPTAQFTVPSRGPGDSTIRKEATSISLEFEV